MADIVKKSCVVIFYAWGRRNAGDHALILGALEMLCALVPQDEIVVVSRYSNADGDICPIDDIRLRFPEVRVVPSPFDLSIKKGRSRIVQIASCTTTVFSSLIFPKRFLRNPAEDTVWHALTSARLVMLNGGNLIFWHKIRKNIARLVAILFPLLLARRLHIKYGTLPQTCGPFEGIVPKWIRSIIEDAEFFTFRDSDSFHHAQSIARLKDGHYALLPDMAFFLSVRQSTKGCTVIAPTDFNHQNSFAVCLRTGPLGYDVKLKHDNPQETERKILAVIPQAIDAFQRETGAHCVIIVQVDQDRPASEKLQKELSDRKVKCSLIELHDPYDFVRYYSNISFLISFRLHSMIFALSQGTPVIGIWRRPLGTKIPAMMKDLKMDDYLLEIDDATVESLLHKMNHIRTHNPSIRDQIDHAVSSRNRTAKQFFEAFIQGC
jgi:polysaccharide pyruvyl transferase WcaK-like protein